MDDEAKPNVRDSGPVEGVRGNREVLPAATGAPDSDPDDVARQRDEYLDALQRLKAEFDNYRKRAAREQVDLTSRAAERLVKELLPVLDDLERALAAAEEHEEATLEEGVRLVHRSLAEALRKEGLAEIETATSSVGKSDRLPPTTPTSGLGAESEGTVTRRPRAAPRPPN